MMKTKAVRLYGENDLRLELPKIPGGKKLIYKHIDMPLIEISDFETLGSKKPLFAKLHEICSKYNSLWNVETENFLLNNA